MITKIILGIIVAHLFIGFGWLVYQLSPRSDDEGKDEKSEFHR